MPITQWSPRQLQEGLREERNLLLLDVREPDEFAYARIEGSKLIPLHRLPEHLQDLNKEQEIVVICHHGIRSQQACLYLQKAGFDRLYNLQGGIDSWSVVCDPSTPRY